MLRTVEFWPSTGDPVLPWLPAPGADAFVRSARRVCELYSEELALVGLMGDVSVCRFITEMGGQDGPVGVLVIVDRPRGFEEVGVTLPAGLELLEPDVRAGLVLQVIHGALSRLAGERGWDRSVLEQVRDRVLARGLAFSWSGGWRTSPDRRRRARVCFDLADDGVGRANVQLQDRDGGPVTKTPQHVAHSTVEGFRRAAKSLRWRGNSGGVFEPTTDGQDRGSTQVAWSIDGATPCRPESVQAWVLPAPDPGAGVVVQARRLAGLVASAEGQSGTEAVVADVRLGGGGPINDVPRAYLLATRVMSAYLETALLPWWAPAGGLLSLGYAFGDVQEGVFLRRTARQTRVIIRRPTASLRLTTADATAQAHEDMTAALRRVGERFHLLPDPMTLTQEVLEAEVTTILHEESNHDLVVRAFIDDVKHLLPEDVVDFALRDLEDHSDVMAWLPLHLPLETLTSAQCQRMRDLVTSLQDGP